jgi:hypothetical protein
MVVPNGCCRPEQPALAFRVGVHQRSVEALPNRLLEQVLRNPQSNLAGAMAEGRMARNGSGKGRQALPSPQHEAGF